MERTQDISFYSYIFGENKQGKEYYGFYKKDLSDALNDYDVVLIIVRNLCVIQRVKEDFPKTLCISIFMYADRDVILYRLKQAGLSEEEIEQRLNRQPRAWDDYLKHPHLCLHPLI